MDSIQFGDPAPVVEGGTARVPLRVTVTAPFSGARTNSERLADESISIVDEATFEGAITGEIVGTCTAIQGAPSTGTDENTFTGTIEGIGDFAGATGTANSVEGVDAVSGTETFELVIPRSG